MLCGNGTQLVSATMCRTGDCCYCVSWHAVESDMQGQDFSTPWMRASMCYWRAFVLYLCQYSGLLDSVSTTVSAHCFYESGQDGLATQ